MVIPNIEDKIVETQSLLTDLESNLNTYREAMSEISIDIAEKCIESIKEDLSELITINNKL